MFRFELLLLSSSLVGWWEIGREVQSRWRLVRGLCLFHWSQCVGVKLDRQMNNDEVRLRQISECGPKNDRNSL